MSETNHLALPFIEAAQAQKHVTHNEALRILDGVTQLAVLDRDVSAPPGSPADGARYLVGASPTGAFAGHAGEIAMREDGAWRFLAPRAGWRVFVADESALFVHDGAAWIAIEALIRTLSNLTGLGVGTAPDAANPFAAKLNAALFAAKTIAEGGTGDLRVSFSKEGASRTASHLFQSNYSGRAEIGLAGDDRLRLRVSADGSAWKDALVADPAADSLTLFTDAQNRLHIDAAGRVGVNNAAPAATLDVGGAIRCGAYAVATVPGAAATGAGAIIFVTDESGGATLAFSDGAAWRRVADRAVIS